MPTEYTPEELADWFEDCAKVSLHPTIVARYRAAAALLRTMARDAARRAAKVADLRRLAKQMHEAFHPTPDGGRADG